MSADQPILPFLKWPGGKRWAGGRITDMIRGCLTGTYYEPFLGGGAVFFELRPRKAVLSDINPELVNTYCVVRDSVEEIISRLKKLPVNKQTYNSLRSAELNEPISRAVRFLYLNRTAFGGIYRLNLNGKFNVPYGGGERTPAALWERALLKNASEALTSAEVRETDFELVINLAKRGDVVYCDPTYTVAHDCNGFVRYNERNFSWSDQVRLADVTHRARERGAVVIISNANHRTIRKLYPNAHFNVLQRRSFVSTDVTKRRAVQELLVRLY